MNYTVRPTRITIAPAGEPLFSEQATHVELDDEAAGEFVVIRQTSESSKAGSVAIDFAEWPLIVQAVETLKQHGVLA
jgi:hypothetical protein